MADSKQHRLEVLLVETVVSKQDSGVRIDIRPWVLDLADFAEHSGDHALALGDEVDPIVVLDVHGRELGLNNLTRVGLAQHGVAVAGHDAAAAERVVDVLLELRVGRLEPDVLDEALEPVEHLLVGEAVQRAGEAGHGRRVGLVGVGERGADQVRGVRGHVAALVVGVDGEVEFHEVAEALVVVADHLAEVVGQADAAVDVDAAVGALVAVVDQRAEREGLRGQVERVLQHVLPEFGFFDALGVGGGKFGVLLQQEHTGRQLGHWV